MKKIIFLCAFLLLFSQFAFGDDAFTGIVIDAHHLGVKSDISPEVLETLTLRGEFGIDYIYKIYPIRYEIDGEVGIETSKQYVGERPLVVKAIARGKDPVIPEVTIKLEDGLKIIQADETSHILRDGKVAIIL